LILCIGVSEALHLVQPELRAIRDMIESDEMPGALEVAQVASNSMTRLKTVEPYLFPPLIQFKSLDASEYVPSTNASDAEAEGQGI